MNFKVWRSQNSPFDGFFGALEGIYITISKSEREYDPAFLTVARDNTRYRCKHYVTLTTFFDMPLVPLEALHTTHSRKQFQDLRRKLRVICWELSSG